LRAVICTKYVRDSRNIEAHHSINILLHSLYRPCSMDDLDLWSIINRQGRQSLLFIYPPDLSQSSRTTQSSTHDIISFAPFSSALITRISIGSKTFNVDDEGPVSAAFGTALALTSYSRGYWGTDAQRKGRNGGIAFPSRQTTIDVELASENVGVEACIPKVSSVQCHVDFQLIIHGR
jgi:hypothetical protein